ncbi:MAG: hypothetical protein P4L74_06620 [Candidatus Doudnabacteria bacterium]|nr:hypothetical protein [Candidatus Doudnabacteria bacterium]
MSGQSIRLDPRGDFSAYPDHQSPEYWDAKLSADRPLLPIDIVGTRLNTVRNYVAQSGIIGGLNERQAISEMRRLEDADKLLGNTVVMVGPGLYSRDAKVYHHAASHGANITTVDKSSVSRKLGTKFFQQLPKLAGTTRRIITADLAEVALNPDTDVLLDTAEFWQILLPDTMEKLAHHVASQYRNKPQNFRMVVVHPFRRDNDKPRVWQNISFDKVQWGDTTPYALVDLKAPLEAGLGYHIEAIDMHQASFYHQVYSSWTFVAQV